MKRLFLMMAAVASVTAAIPAATALARDDQGHRGQRHDRGRGGFDGERGPRRMDRGPGYEGRFERGPRERDDARRARVPALGYGDAPRGRRDDDDRPRDRYEGPARAPRGFAGPPPSTRRGGYLPRDFSGEIVDDYRRYRLRTPPAGFAWVRMGRGFALVSMRDGQVFDVVQ
jgi:Ni/Co efflux regulator RcnB